MDRSPLADMARAGCRPFGGKRATTQNIRILFLVAVSGTSLVSSRGLTGNRIWLGIGVGTAGIDVYAEDNAIGILLAGEVFGWQPPRRSRVLLVSGLSRRARADPNEAQADQDLFLPATSRTCTLCYHRDVVRFTVCFPAPEVERLRLSNALIGIGASTDRQGPLPHHPACGSAPGGS